MDCDCDSDVGDQGLVVRFVLVLFRAGFRVKVLIFGVLSLEILGFWMKRSFGVSSV